MIAGVIAVFCGVGWFFVEVFPGMVPRRVRRVLPSEKLVKRGGGILLVSLVVAIISALSYATGQEICAKGWREVYILSAKPNQR